MKPTLSPTKYATYLECALKYRFVYLDRIGRYYMRARPQYSFGATMHQVLREFHEAGMSDTLARMLERYERAWVSAGYEFPEDEAEARMDGREMLMAYHAAVTLPEHPPAETILLEKRVAAEIGPFVLEGRVDRVDRHPDGTLEIIDYKTSRVTATAALVAEDIRMGIYQLILRSMYPETPVIATIFNLRTSRAASAQLIAPELFADDILSLGEEILARDYETLQPARSPVCETCDFLTRCERAWAGEAPEAPMASSR